MDVGIDARTDEDTVVRPPMYVEPVCRKAGQIHHMRCVWRVRKFVMPGMTSRSEGYGITCDVTVAR